MKTNWNDLDSVISYCNKVGGIVIKNRTRSNYNIVPTTRPDLFVDGGIEIKYIPPNAIAKYTAFDYGKCPSLLPYVRQGLQKLDNFRG